MFMISQCESTDWVLQVARTPALPANQVNEAKVITAMPTVNLMARRLVSDRAPLQVAHLNSVQRLAVYLKKGWLV